MDLSSVSFSFFFYWLWINTILHIQIKFIIRTGIIVKNKIFSERIFCMCFELESRESAAIPIISTKHQKGTRYSLLLTLSFLNKISPELPRETRKMILIIFFCIYLRIQRSIAELTGWALRSKSRRRSLWTRRTPKKAAKLCFNN